MPETYPRITSYNVCYTKLLRLVLGAVVFESLFLLLRKTVPEPLSPLAVSTVISLYGLLWFLPGGIVEAASTDLSAVSMAGWLTVGYYGVFVTVLAYLFWFAGIVRVAAATAGVFTASYNFV